MESRDIRKSFAHMNQKVRDTRNADNSLLSRPVEPIKMLFISTSSGWERISTENNGRIDCSSKSLRQNYGMDSPNAMLKYACRNRAQERLQQGLNDKHAFPGGDLMRREVPESTGGRRSSRVEAPPPLVGSPDMPMPGIPVAEVRESVMISRPPSGPSIVEKKPSVTNLHGSRPNWTRMSKEATCSRNHGGGSRHRDFPGGLMHDSNTHHVERISSSDLHSASSVFQTVSKALESQKRNKRNYDSSTDRKHLNLDHRFNAPVDTSEYSSSQARNRPDIQRERTATLLNDMNNSVFHSLSSFDEMLKTPDMCEYSNFNLHANSSMIRIAQNAQRDLDQSVIKFEELIDVVSSTITEIYNISTSDSYDSCISNVPNRHEYRRYRQVQEVTSNLNYVTTDPGVNPLSVSAFTTTTVTNIGESRRSNHSVGDSFLNDYPKKSNDFTPHIDGYKFNADESGDRNTRNICIEYSSTKNHCDKDFQSQEGDKQDNIYENEEKDLPKTLNLEPSVKNQEVNTDEKGKTNTLESDSAKERSCDVNETQEPGRCADVTEKNKSPDKVNDVPEGIDGNAFAKSENITQRQECNKPVKPKDTVDINSSGFEKSPNRSLETRITKLNDHKFYKSVTPVEIAHSIISDYSKSISESININPTCQQKIGCNFEKNELKIKEDVKFNPLDNTNDTSQNGKYVNSKTTKSSETSEFSDSMPNTPRNAELEFRPCARVTMEEKSQHIINSDQTCERQEGTATDKEADIHSEVNTTEVTKTKMENVIQQGESGDIKKERSKRENTSGEANSYESEKFKDCTGTHILQSLDRKVLDVMELVKNQLQKERTRQSTQLENANVRKKTQKNAVVRNESVRFAKDEKPSRHVLQNKQLDSRSPKILNRGNSSRHEVDLEAVLRSRRQDHQREILNDSKSSDTSRDSNGEEKSYTNLNQIATLSVISEDSDVCKQPEPDQRSMLDTLVDNVTGMIKLKKFQMCLMDTMKNGAAETEPRRCKKKVPRAISPVNLRLQRKSALPKSLPELDKEHISSIGLYPTSARCSLMCQDNRVECISPDLKKRGEEIRKTMKPKETTKELKVNKIGMSNNVLTAAKRDYNREVKSVVKNHARVRKCDKCISKHANKRKSEPSNVKNTEITIADDMESGSEKISPVCSSANVYDIKINIINRTTSNTNIKEEDISEMINNDDKEICSQAISNSSDKSIINSCSSLNETPQEQHTIREKSVKPDKKHYTECKSNIRSNKTGLSKIDSNKLNDADKENLLQTETNHIISPEVKGDFKDNTLKSAENLQVSNNDTRLTRSQSGNNHLSLGDNQPGKNNKSLSDSYVKDRNTYLKRNIRITKRTSPTNSHSRMGDGELYHNTTKVTDNYLQMNEQRRNKFKSSEKSKDSTDKFTKCNSRYIKPCQVARTDLKTKPGLVSGTYSHVVQKPTKATTIKATTSSDLNEPGHTMSELFEGFASGSYVKVDAKLCTGEQKVTYDASGISKVHVKTNASKRLSCNDTSLHKPDVFKETKRKTKLFSGYGAAVLIKPDGKVTEINLGKNVCPKRNCNCSKQRCCGASGGRFQVEISQTASSPDREVGGNMNENSNKVIRHANDSFNNIISSKYSAVKLFFEKPSLPLEEKIIGQVSYSENGLVGGNKSHVRPFDFMVNGIKFSDSRKLVTHKTSIINKSNSIYDTEGLCFFNTEENSILIDRNKIVPTIYRRGSAQSRGLSLFKEMPVFEKRLSTLLEILESLINEDKHENTCYKSDADNHDETETRETTEEVVSAEDKNVDYTKHIAEDNAIEHTFEYEGNEEVSTMVSETCRGNHKSEISIIVPPSTTKNNLIQLETDATQTISVKGKCLVFEEGKKFYESENGEITTNEFSFVVKSKELSAEEGIISQPHRKDSMESNIELTHDFKIENKSDENISNRPLIHIDVKMPPCKSRSYELETLKEYEDGISTESTDNSNRNEFLNRSRSSSCSTLFSSCDSLTTNDYVEIFRGYIDGDNSTEKEVDLYDDSTESSNVTKNNFFTKQQIEDWKMNILRNRPNYLPSAYNIIDARDSTSNSTAHYPSESEVSTHPQHISTQSSNISSFKRLYCTDSNENKSINNFERRDIRQNGCNCYSVAELSKSKHVNTEKIAENYWTFEDYLRVCEPPSARGSSRIGINMETCSEVTSSNVDKEIFPSLSSIISKCVEETLNNTLRDITKTFDFEKYGHVLTKTLQSYGDSEQSSCQELTVTETQPCETTDSESNIYNCDGNIMRTTRININHFSEDTNEYPSSCTNSHKEMLSTGYNEVLNYSSSNSEEDASKGNCTSNVYESSQCGMFHSTISYSTVRKSVTTWQRGSQEIAEEEYNSQASSQDQTNPSFENSEMDESSTLEGSSESVQDETSVAVLDLTSPETVTRVLDAMTHSEECQPIDDELEGEMGVFEFNDMPEFVLDESVIHASSDFALPYPTEDCENTRSEDSLSLSRLAEQYSAAVLTRRETSSAFLEGVLRRLSMESTSTEVSRRWRTREDRGGGALAISICICLFVFVCNRSFLYGDDEY